MSLYVWNGTEFTKDIKWVPNPNGAGLISQPQPSVLNTEEVVTTEPVVELEEEIVNQETILNYYDTLSISDRAALTASLRTTELAIIAREKAALIAVSYTHLTLPTKRIV